jgi:hypothetical protein
MTIPNIDWSVFDKYDEYECICHCDTEFKSHVKALPNVGLISQKKCPRCGSNQIRKASATEVTSIGRE